MPLRLAIHSSEKRLRAPVLCQAVCCVKLARLLLPPPRARAIHALGVFWASGEDYYLGGGVDEIP